VEDDLRFEAGEQMAAEAYSVADIPIKDMDAFSTIPTVHLTFDIIRCRVHIFSQLVEAWPECISFLVKSQLSMVGITKLFAESLGLSGRESDL